MCTSPSVGCKFYLLCLAMSSTTRSRLADDREQISDYWRDSRQQRKTVTGAIRASIPKTKMKCLKKEPKVQCTESNPGETQEEPGLESPHSAQNLQAPEAPGRVNQQVRVKLPAASKKREWQQFAEDVTKITRVERWKGDADSQLQALTTVILSYLVEHFSREDEKIIKTPYIENRRTENSSTATGAPRSQKALQDCRRG